MKHITIIIVITQLVGCKPVPVTHWFPGTPLEAYEKYLFKTGAEKTAAADSWFSNAKKVLNDTLHVTVPYAERFHLGDSATAQSVRIIVPEGRSLIVRTIKNTEDSLSLLFLELYEISTGKKPRRVEYLKENAELLTYTPFGRDTLLLRIQTGVNQKAVISVMASSQPTLAFPVPNRGMQDVISHWGAERDRGIRLHEGIDIRAKKGTPVVASAPGTITQVTTNNLGGKVLFLAANHTPYSLYYAHLDSQLVYSGKRVIAGDTLGLVGNTGNAITTAPHLHFGIYTRNEGAVNPLPFLDNREEKIPRLPQSSRWLGDSVRISKKTTLFASPSFQKNTRIRPIPAHTPLLISGEVSKGFRVQLSDGTKGYIPDTPFTQKESKDTRASASASF